MAWYKHPHSVHGSTPVSKQIGQFSMITNEPKALQSKLQGKHAEPQEHVGNFVQSVIARVTHNFLLGVSFTTVCGALEGSSTVLPKHFFVRASRPGFCKAIAVNKPETLTFCPVSNCSCNTFRTFSRTAFVSLSVQLACWATRAMKFAI